MRHGVTGRRMAAAAAAIAWLVLAAVVWAQGPWRKPPEQWSDKQAKKVLNDSPWARTSILPYHPYTELGSGAQTSTGVRIGQVPRDPLDTQDRGSDWPIITRWSSSKSIRRALNRTGKGSVSGDRPSKWIEITVISATLTQPLPYWKEEDLRGSTWIKFGRNDKQRAPDDVRVDRGSTSYHADAYVFAFKSVDENGRALVDEGVKEVEFQCRLGPVAIRAKFEPAKMVAHDGPDY